MKNGASVGLYTYAYTVHGGWTKNGNATNNTITLERNGITSYDGTYLNGGWSGKAGADVKTGNKLRVIGKSNYGRTINNFEKMEFELNSAVASGDTMLSIRTQTSPQTFDWNKVKVTGLRAWATALAENNVNTPTLTLYSGVGAPLTLNHYAPTIVGTRGDYEFGKRANGALSGTTMTGASILTLDGNRFQNAVKTPTANAADIHAGISVYGNTTNHNTLNLKDNAGTPLSFTNARAGYTNAQSGGSDFNTLNLLSGGSIRRARRIRRRSTPPRMPTRRRTSSTSKAVRSTQAASSTADISLQIRRSSRRTTSRQVKRQATPSTLKKEPSVRTLKSTAATRTARARRRATPSTLARVTAVSMRPR